ncbi:MAG TPA: uroporphyrinogen decarboxylase family protein [Clostridia bacterium]|nr:uroporphyrinogen decarboxylase family protein [Clostridia bacterium]
MMNSRERLLAAVNLEPLDRVPFSGYELDRWCNDGFYKTEPSYKELMDYLAKKADRIYMTNEDRGEFRLQENREWRGDGCTYSESIIHAPGRDLRMLQKKNDNVNTWWVLEHYCKDLEDIEAYINVLPDKASCIDMTKVLREKEEAGDSGIVMLSPADPIGEGAHIVEMGEFLVYCITETDTIKRFLDAIFEVQMYHLRQILKYDVKDVMFRICGPEYATPPYLSPEMFNEIVTKYLIIMCREIREAGGIPRIHCHGKIRNVLDEFLLTDAMALDPCEPPPDGDADLAYLKAKCGDRFCLMGGMELHELENSSPQRVREIVRRSMEMAKGTTGYIMLATAAPINVPLSEKTRRNYIEMVEATIEYGKY